MVRVRFYTFNINSLSSMDVSYSEGPVNLNWGQIMKTVQEDTKSFFTEGGWSFLQAESDVEQSEESGMSTFFIDDHA